MLDDDTRLHLLLDVAYSFFMRLNMGSVLHLTSPIPPSVNHYLAYRTTISKTGKAIGMSYTTAEAKKYRKNFANYVIEEIERQSWDLVPNTKQHFYIDAWFYFARIDVDANNYWKILIDAITDTQKIWIDDNVVCERVQRIQYDSVNPRVELRVSPVDYIGIFENSERKDDFISSNCIGCSRYKRNCSILKNAINGKIQDVADQYACLSKRPIKSK